MKFEHRTYESAAVRRLRVELPQHKRVIAVAPTGSGKTVVASMLLKAEPRWKRVLFLAHSYELIDQAYRTLTSHGLRCGVIMAHDFDINGTERIDPKARVQVGSVQTIARRGVPPGTDLIIFDEAHRVMADSYQEIAASCPRAQVLGLTATPYRMDGRGLADYFASMVVIAKPSDLFADGFLAEPKVYTAPPGIAAELVKRTKGKRKSNGDFSHKDLAKIVDSAMLLGSVVDEGIRLAPSVPKLVFAGSVKHSLSIVRKFKRRGITAAHVDSETDADERVRILEAFSTGAIEVVSNVNVLSEGYDLPRLGAVILARPTMSLARYFQMCGRVMRPFKGRKPIVIDHGGNVMRHQWLPSEDYPWSLLDSDERNDGEPVLKECADCYVVIPAGCYSCPSCGAKQPIKERTEREEMDVELEEMRRSKMQEMRARVERMAEIKGASKEWVEKVVAEMAA